jgi:hypothetical protein
VALECACNLAYDLIEAIELPKGVQPICLREEALLVLIQIAIQGVEHMFGEIEARECVTLIHPLLEVREQELLPVPRNDVETLLDGGEVPRDDETDLLSSVNPPVEGGVGGLLLTSLHCVIATEDVLVLPIEHSLL